MKFSGQSVGACDCGKRVEMQAGDGLDLARMCRLKVTHCSLESGSYEDRQTRPLSTRMRLISFSVSQYSVARIKKTQSTRVISEIYSFRRKSLLTKPTRR
jgi:hypothetical protein